MIHLHRHGQFSRLDGVGTDEAHAEQAAKHGQPALGQTDHGTLSGALHHIHGCRKHGIMPINGIEAYFRPDRAKAKADGNRQAWHLCLFAKNLRGWHNLLRLTSVAYMDVEEDGGFYQYPCVDFELLDKYKEGLIASTACFQSWLAEMIYSGDSRAASHYVKQMQKIFKDDLFVELMPHDFDDQRSLNKELLGIADDFSIPIMATNDAHFPAKEWAETQRVAKLIGVNKTFKKVKEDQEKGKDQYLADLTPRLYVAHEEEMRLWFDKYHPDIPERRVDESIKNTYEFASRITPFILSKELKLPKVTSGEDEAEQIINEWIEDGFDRLAGLWEEDGLDDDEIDKREAVYRERTQYEHEILKSKGVFNYFVMVGEVVRWCKSEEPLPSVKKKNPKAKKKPIRVALGRGSAGGCLIAYLAGITGIDPIAYDLLFERFLNPERKGLPDIDIDFDSDRRPEVKKFVAERYGQDHVADIITHSTFQPKAVVTDVLKVYDVPWAEARKITETIDIRQDDEETTLEELLPLNDALQECKEKWPEAWEHMLRLEGQVKNAGKHAAGVIITPKPVVEYMALERGKKGDLVTSWSDAADFPAVSEYGLVKADFLGIVGLSRHEYACRLVEERTGEMPDLDGLPALRDPYRVDEKAMDIFREGKTFGVFQFGGKGITSLLRQIEPDDILDLTAANALYRPGPIKGGVVWEYPKRKKNKLLRTYWHKEVKPYLQETYGVIAYQEQIMRIAQALGDFTGAQSDDLRKAMGKLYRIKGGSAAKDFMAQYETQWFDGCKRHGISREAADEIWEKFLEFGHYGFNKSHSACYALQAYQDAWLKAHYPLEFYAALLTYAKASGDKDKRMQAIREARSNNIKVLPPDVNKSGTGWGVDFEENSLRMALSVIDGVGPVAAAEIFRERPFKSYFDLKKRCSFNKKVSAALAESGALDCFGVREDVDPKQIIEWEKARLKMTLSVDTGVYKHAEVLRQNIYTQDEVEAADQDEEVIVGGEVTKVEKKKTKNGRPFANVTIAFEANEWRVKFWEEQLRRFGGLLEEGNAVMVNGAKDEWNGYVSVVAEEAVLLEDAIGQMEADEIEPEAA